MGHVIQFVVFVVTVLILAGLGMVYTSQFLEYLKKHHPFQYEEVIMKSFLGIPSEYFAYLQYLKKHHPFQYEEVMMKSFSGIPSEYFAYLVNPVHLIWFLFSAESLDDDRVVFHKRRLKISLFSIIASFVAWCVFIAV
jgi:hypothetical protein